MKNFSPISILPDISKVFQNIAYDRFYSFLDRKITFNSKQFGFRRKPSTIDALSEYTVQSRQGSHDTFPCILHDLPKAFESINQKNLWAKPLEYGVKGICLKCFQSYLKEPRQSVQVNFVFSDFLNLLVGVPQGSVFGPLLFLLCINGLLDACEILK